MLIDHLHLLTANFFDFLDQPQWRAWPFDSGYGETILPAIARMVFVALIIGALCLFLRLLFGPKGWFRDHELDREAEEERQREKAELDRMLANGEITEFEYKVRLKGLD